MTDRENSFNLIDEKWIPIAGQGLMSLKEVFSTDRKSVLSDRNPVEKIAMFKLLLAIGQAVFTPETDENFNDVSLSDFRKKVLDYLESHHDDFFLYGEKPFLQYSYLKKYKSRQYAKTCLEFSAGNNAITFETQHIRPLSDDEKARYLLVELGFCRTGKGAFGEDDKIIQNDYPAEDETDDEVNAEQGHSKGCNVSGTCLGNYVGYLHSFLQSDTVSGSVYLNLLSKEKIEQLEGYGKICPPPWEKLPSKGTPYASEFKSSYVGRLIPMNREILLGKHRVRYEPGISGLTDDTKVKIMDPTVPVLVVKGELKPMYSDVEKKTWRELSAILASSDSCRFVCNQIRMTKHRFSKSFSENNIPYVFWIGGLGLKKPTTGEQTIGEGDYICSSFEVPFGPDDSVSLVSLDGTMNFLEEQQNNLDRSIGRYYKKLGSASKPNDARRDFWNICEQIFPRILKDIGTRNDEGIERMKRYVRSVVRKLYDRNCPKTTARQIEAWAMFRP